jgi:cell shape-determining protein MreD
VKPNLLLVGVILATVLAGFLTGVVWAFVGGLTANLLVGDPLGSVPLTMLLVAAGVAGGARVMGRMVWIYPVIATFVGSIVVDLGGILLRQLVAGATPGPIPTDLVLAAATLNAAIAGLAYFPARALYSRYTPEEAAAW